MLPLSSTGDELDGLGGGIPAEAPLPVVAQLKSQQATHHLLSGAFAVSRHASYFFLAHDAMHIPCVARIPSVAYSQETKLVVLVVRSVPGKRFA